MIIYCYSSGVGLGLCFGNLGVYNNFQDQDNVNDFKKSLCVKKFDFLILRRVVAKWSLEFLTLCLKKCAIK